MAHPHGWLKGILLANQGLQLAQCLPTTLRSCSLLTQHAFDSITSTGAAPAAQAQQPRPTNVPSIKTGAEACTSAEACPPGTVQQGLTGFDRHSLGSGRHSSLLMTRRTIASWHGQAPLFSQPQHHQNQQQQQQPNQRQFMNLPSSLDQFNSPDRVATNTIMAACVVLSLAAMVNRRLFMAFVQINTLLAQGEWWRIVTASFIHGGILHLACNMLALNFLGPPIEQLVGRTCFAAIYLSGAIGGGLAYYQYGHWMGAAMGSSGALAGLFSAYVVYKLHNRGVVAWTQYDTSYVGQMLALNVMLAFALSSTLAHSAHLGGLAGGGLAMLLLGPRLKWQGGTVVNQPLIPIFKDMP